MQPCSRDFNPLGMWVSLGGCRAPFGEGDFGLPRLPCPQSFEVTKISGCAGICWELEKTLPAPGKELLPLGWVSGKGGEAGPQKLLRAKLPSWDFPSILPY